MAKDNKELLAKMNGNGTEKALTPVEQVQHYLNTPYMKSQLAMALPKHVTADRLTRIFVTTIRNTPTLMECTVPSLMSCIVQAAQLGVEIGTLGQAYAVPFNKNIAKKGEPARWVKEAQFILGYRGMIDLARRSGDIKTIGAQPIYEKDTFRVEYGFESVLQHIPAFGERGKIIGFYAFAVTKDGGQYCEVMSAEQVETIRSRSKAKDNGPWVSDWSEMGRKTVLRRLFKYLPCSIEIRQHIKDDEEREFADVQSIELNLGEPKQNVLEGGNWPALDANAEPALTQDRLDNITQKSNEKLLAKRKEATIDEVVSLIPPGPGDVGEPDLFNDFDVVPGDRD